MVRPTTPCSFRMAEAEIIVRSDERAVAKAAAERFAAAVTQAVEQRGQALVALSGGTTPLAMFHLLAQPPYLTDLPWDKIQLFWADERLVPPNDPGSNYGAAEQTLLQHVPLPRANIHRMRGEWPADLAVADYAAQLAALAEMDHTKPAWPRFDLVLLGLGSDGHTASLFPGSAVVVAAPVIVAHAEYDGRPAERLSLTPPVINAAREVVFVATGEAKAGAVAAVLEGDRDPVRRPAQRIQPSDGALVWLLDRAAAGQSAT